MLVIALLLFALVGFVVYKVIVDGSRNGLRRRGLPRSDVAGVFDGVFDGGGLSGSGGDSGGHTSSCDAGGGGGDCGGGDGGGGH